MIPFYQKNQFKKKNLKLKVDLELSWIYFFFGLFSILIAERLINTYRKKILNPDRYCRLYTKCNLNFRTCIIDPDCSED